MKMNKTRLLEKISIQSGVSLDECGTVLKTFEKVLSEELSRKIYRYGGWILLLTALFVSVTVFSQTTGRERTSGADHPWDCYRWRLEVSDTVCNSKAI